MYNEAKNNTAKTKYKEDHCSVASGARREKKRLSTIHPKIDIKKIPALGLIRFRS